jgi:hypothetical protein
MWDLRGHGQVHRLNAVTTPTQRGCSSGRRGLTVSIAVDTPAAPSKEAIRGAEKLVHGITIFAGISSCVLLCTAYQHRGISWIPAMVLTLISLLYSLVDEAFHWRRYVGERADRVEMWSHVGILLGHSTMMVAWWVWFFAGYPGVRETLVALSR